MNSNGNVAAGGRGGAAAEAELERFLRRVVDVAAAAAPPRGEAMAARGQAGRYPARRLPSHLRQQGFQVTRHFLDRLRERAQAQGIRFDPRTFARDFLAARHLRQTRPGYNTRIAVMRGLPVLYRMGGERGNRVVLVGALPPGERLPPTAPAAPPRPRRRQREALYEDEVPEHMARRGGHRSNVRGSTWQDHSVVEGRRGREQGAARARARQQQIEAEQQRQAREEQALALTGSRNPTAAQWDAALQQAEQAQAQAQASLDLANRRGFVSEIAAAERQRDAALRTVQALRQLRVAAGG